MAYFLKQKALPFLLFIAFSCLRVEYSTAQVTLLTEQFSGGALPAGWTNNIIVGVGGTDTWRYNNPGSRTTFAPISGNFAIFDSDSYSNNSTAEDVALETSSFDASAYTGALTLSFDHMYRYCCSGDAVVEVFNGSSWVQVYSAGSTNVGYSTFTASQSIDILAAAAGSTVARVRFRFTGNWSWWWAIDNILIQGTLPAVAGPGGISSNLALWLKADSGGAAWTDQSPVGVTVATVGSPTLNVGTINYNDQITFNGSTDRYDLTSAAFTTGTADRAIYAVSQRPNNGTAANYIVSFGGNGTNSSLNFGHWLNFPNDPFLSTSSREVASNDGSWPINTPALTAYTNISGTDGLRTNGTALSIAQDNASHSITGGTTGKVGSFQSGTSYWNGDIAEVIVYNGATNTGTEQNQIESYLALKYGITIAHDYLASDGTVLWDYSTLTTYNNDITGIGVDSLISGLNQKQSKSINSDAIVAIGLKNIEATNALSTAYFGDNLRFMLWGNNNGNAAWTTTGAPTDFNILERQWHIEETGSVDAVQVQFDVGDTDFDVPAYSFGTAYYLVYDSDNDGSLSDELPVELTNASGNIWQTSTAINFSNRMEFTIAAYAVNPPCTPTFTEFTIDGNFDGCVAVHAEDMDGDGDIDILGAGNDEDEITWWENDGNESFTEHVVESAYNGSAAVYAFDINQDGDMDILGTALYSNVVTWWENDGSENFTTHTIETGFDGGHAVYPADIDSDGDIDVVAGSFFGDEVAWWENDGSENFTRHDIDNSFDGTRQVYAIDLDDDSDMDIMAAGYFENEITWWENDGSENFTERVIQSGYTQARGIFAIDVDSDGDKDVLGVAYTLDEVTWWENDGSENFTERTIDANYGGAGSVQAVDLDRDGDVDVLSTSIDDNEVTWWENDGSENFTEHTLTSSYTGGYFIVAKDVNGDRYLDLITGGRFNDDVTWWEQAGCPEPNCGNIIMNRHVSFKVKQ